MSSDLPTLEALAMQLRDGERTAAGLMETMAARHAEHDLGAYKTWAGDSALETARHVDGLLAAGYDSGPLMGVPTSVKDLYGVPGLPVFAGTDAALPNEWQRPGPLVGELLAQLGVITGKTHTVEMAFGGIGANAHWTPPQNPWGDGTRIPGGSSSGAGVSLAEGSALLALGTDTAGSVRIPASVTGNVGLKITHSRWSTEGIFPLSPSFDTPGLLTRSVADLLFAFAALDPHDPEVDADSDLAGLRIGVLGGVMAEGVDDDIATLVTNALRLAELHGARLADTDLHRANDALAIFRQGGLAAPELAAFLARYMPDRIARMDPSVRARVEGAAGLSAVDYLRRRAEFRDMADDTAANGFAGFDVLAAPTIAISPPVLAELDSPERYGAANMAVLRNTAVANLLGLCAITLPIGLDRNNMPAGLMLIAAPWQEERLIAAAIGFERILGTGADLLGRTPVLNSRAQRRSLQ